MSAGAGCVLCIDISLNKNLACGFNSLNLTCRFNVIIFVLCDYSSRFEALDAVW